MGKIRRIVTPYFYILHLWFRTFHLPNNRALWHSPRCYNLTTSFIKLFLKFHHLYLQSWPQASVTRFKILSECCKNLWHFTNLGRYFTIIYIISCILFRSYKVTFSRSAASRSKYPTLSKPIYHHGSTRSCVRWGVAWEPLRDLRIREFPDPNKIWSRRGSEQLDEQPRTYTMLPRLSLRIASKIASVEETNLKDLC